MISKKQVERMSICQSCPHLTGGQWCGKPLKGGTVEHEGKEMKLCGCNVRAKTALRWTNCPLGKWSADITKSDVRKAKAWLKKYDANPERVNNKELYELWEKFTGKKKSSNCLPCIKTDIQELRKMILEFEK